MRHILPSRGLVGLVIVIAFTSLASGGFAGLLVSLAV
jgi:hypothetical protein